MKEQLIPIIKQFISEGNLMEAIPFGEGHVNDTYRILMEQGDKNTFYVLQRINTNTFLHPVELMSNIMQVTNHIRPRKLAQYQKENNKRDPVHFLLSADNKSYVIDKENGYWRLQTYADNTYCLQQPQSAEEFYQSARAFGEFQQYLSDYDASRLFETIPHFHDTPLRYEAFSKAVQSDPLDRAKEVKKEIQFVEERRDECSFLVDLLKNNALPLRVTHNDTKLNNVLFDCDSHVACEVVDLDTVMPGLVAYDFGDSIRFGANTALEDEMDLSKVDLSLELFEAYTKGFLETAGKSLTEKEIETLPWGAYLMTLECGIRFLTDYLEGDTYFKIAYDSHNLVRARNQFALITKMEEKWDSMEEIISRNRA